MNKFFIILLCALLILFSGCFEEKDTLVIKQDANLSDVNAIVEQMNINWIQLQNYPLSCGPGEAVQTIDDILVCVAVSGTNDHSLLNNLNWSSAGHLLDSDLSSSVEDGVSFRQTNISSDNKILILKDSSGIEVANITSVTDGGTTGTQLHLTGGVSVNDTSNVGLYGQMLFLNQTDFSFGQAVARLNCDDASCLTYWDATGGIESGFRFGYQQDFWAASVLNNIGFSSGGDEDGYPYLYWGVYPWASTYNNSPAIQCYSSSYYGASSQRCAIGKEVDSTDGNYLQVDSAYVPDLYADNLNVGTINANLINVNELNFTDSYWEDVYVPVITSMNGTNAPDLTDFNSAGTYAKEFQDNTALQEDEVYFTFQMPHAYKIGTSFKAHLHWTPDSSNTGNSRFKLNCTKADIDGIFSTTTGYSDLNATNSSFLAKHKIQDFNNTFSCNTISCIMECTLRRTSSDVKDTYASGTYIHAIDFHIEMDSVGSRDETSK
jgi:hypothetical protein